MQQISDHFERRREEFRRYSSGVLTGAELDAMYSILGERPPETVVEHTPDDGEPDH